MDSTGRGCAIGRSRRPSSRRSKVQWTRPTLTSIRPTWTACHLTTSAAGMWTSKSTKHFFFFFFDFFFFTRRRRSRSLNLLLFGVNVLNSPTTTTTTPLQSIDGSKQKKCSEPFDKFDPSNVRDRKSFFFFSCFTPERYAKNLIFLRLVSPYAESAFFKSV